MTRTVRLVERQSRVVKLPRDDAEFAARCFGPFLEVMPTFTPDRYRITPRSHVGFVNTPSVRFEIAPKLPWSAVLMLLGLKDAPLIPGGLKSPIESLLAPLAEVLSRQMRVLADAGLVRGYQEQDADSRFLRGKLRAREQLQDAARGRTPDLFRILDDAFDLDTPWNRAPKAVASSVLTQPELPSSTREQLSAALKSFADVPDAPISEADFTAAEAEPRAAAYRDAITVCRCLWEGFGALAPEGGHPAFLLDLGWTFERYVAQIAQAAFADRAAWSVEAQPIYPVGGLNLQPDLVVRRRGKARAVLDTKWKTPGPNAGDVQQVLAYAAVTGARHAALVYPGRRLAIRRLGSAGSGIRLSLIRFPVFTSVALTPARLATRLVHLR